MACPALRCGLANPVIFRFCMHCGKRRPELAPLGEPDERYGDHYHAALLARLWEVERGALVPTYAYQRDKRWSEWCTWVEAARRHCWRSATPLDVVLYFVHKDESASTTVHAFCCDNFGKSWKMATACRCPKRAKASSLKTIVGQLRGKFRDLTQCHTYDEEMGTGNMFAAPRVARYIASAAMEQQRARVVVEQARPVLLPELHAICSAIYARVFPPQSGRAWERYAFTQMAAFICLDLYSANRPTQLGKLVASEVYIVPSGGEGRPRMMLLDCHVGKTVRQQANHIFAIPEVQQPVVCAFFWMEQMRLAAAACGLPVGAEQRGHLFFDVQPDKQSRRPFTTERMQRAFDRFLRDEKLEKASLRGLRAGGAIELALQGAEIDAIMQQGNWARKSTAEYYMHIRSVLGAGGAAACFAKGTYSGPSGCAYSDANSLRDVMRVFPAKPS